MPDHNHAYVLHSVQPVEDGTRTVTRHCPNCSDSVEAEYTPTEAEQIRQQMGPPSPTGFDNTSPVAEIYENDWIDYTLWLMVVVMIVMMLLVIAAVL